MGVRARPQKEQEVQKSSGIWCNPETSPESGLQRLPSHSDREAANYLAHREVTGLFQIRKEVIQANQ